MIPTLSMNNAPANISTDFTCSRSTWQSEGYGYIDTLMSLALWALHLCIGFFFLQRAQAHVHCHDNIEHLHDLHHQALGVVSAQQTRLVFGKRIRDPRRFLQLCAMWLEWPAFTLFVVGNVILGNEYARGPSFMQDGDKLRNSKTTSLQEEQSFLPSMTQILTVLGALMLFLAFFSALSLALSSPSDQVAPSFRFQYVYPLLLDAGYIVAVSTAISLGSCTSGVRQLRVTAQGDTTCECTHIFPYMASVGLLAFTVVYVGALHLKSEVESRALYLRFRFQIHFAVLMTMMRTAIPLLGVLVLLLHQFLSLAYVAILTGFLYMVVMIALLCYNYKYQPCIGSGRIPNNIRAVSFSGGAFTSLVLMVHGFLLLAGQASYSRHFLLPLYTVALPLLLVGAWVINNFRSMLFHIPVAPLTDLLSSANERWRTVTCIAATLLPKESLTQREQRQVLHLMYQCFNKANVTEVAKLHIAASIWHFQRRYRTQQNLVQETSTSCGDDGLMSEEAWLPFSSHLLPLSHTMWSRKQKWGQQARYATALKAYEKALVSNIPRLSDASALESSLLDQWNRRTIDFASSVLWLSKDENNCILAAEFLQHAYQVMRVRLRRTSFLRMACLLAGYETSSNVNLHAIATLHHLLVEVKEKKGKEHPNVLDSLPISIFALLSPHGLGCLVRTYRQQNDVVSLQTSRILNELLTFALEQMKDASKKKENMNIWRLLDKKCISSLQEAFVHHSENYDVSIHLEKILLRLHENFHVAIQRANVDDRIRSLKRHGRQVTQVTPLTSTVKQTNLLNENGQQSSDMFRNLRSMSEEDLLTTSQHLFQPSIMTAILRHQTMRRSIERLHAKVLNLCRQRVKPEIATKQMIVGTQVSTSAVSTVHPIGNDTFDATTKAKPSMALLAMSNNLGSVDGFETSSTTDLPIPTLKEEEERQEDADLEASVCLRPCNLNFLTAAEKREVHQLFHLVQPSHGYGRKFLLHLYTRGSIEERSCVENLFQQIKMQRPYFFRKI